jgi:hypothetical protein
MTNCALAETYLSICQTMTLAAGTWIMYAIYSFTIVVMIMAINVFQSLNKWWVNDPNAHFHILFSELWSLSVTLALTAGTYILHTTLRLTMEKKVCQIILKSLYACRSFALDKSFSITLECELDQETWL